MARDDDGLTVKNGQKRAILYVLALFVVFLEAGLYAARQQSTPRVAATTWTSSLKRGENSKTIDHPIPKLMAEAEDNFRNLLQRQSKTLDEAVAEYQRRYGRNPPKGFDDWFAFAQSRDVKIIDDYDAISEDLSPFFNFSGAELRRRVSQVGHLPSIDLVRIENGKVRAMNMQQNLGQDIEISERANGFRRIVEKFRDRLPNMDFPINGKAEGRILIPWEHKQYPNLTVQDTSGGIESVLGQDFTADWRGDGNVWESWRRICSPDSKARKLFSSLQAPASPKRPENLLQGAHDSKPSSSVEPRFAATVDDNFDFCKEPSAHYMQGHFFSDWRTIPVLYPVFSPAKGQGYMDIRIPSHYYHQATPMYSYGWDTINLVGKEFDDMETAWENKTDIIFWRGATTGGGNTPTGFAAQYQRHRFVRMTSDKSKETRQVVFPSPEDPSKFVSAEVPVNELNEEIMDVAFVRLTGWANYPGGRAALRAAHRFDKSVPLGDHWRYRYLVDVDGMGYSGRFFAFLASDSVPVKSTVYSEYFSDWLQPWLHYIPLSQSYQELYDIYAFFSGATPSMMKAVNSTSSSIQKPEDGERRLRRIARAGKQWKKTIGRPVDMEAYVYRLALEWARLWSDDRESLSMRVSQSNGTDVLA